MKIVELFRGDVQGADGIEAFVEKNNLRFPVFHDPTGTNADALGMKRMPGVFVLDRDGVVVWEGTLSDSVAPTIEMEIRNALVKSEDNHVVASSTSVAPRPFLGVIVGAADRGGIRIDEVTENAAAAHAGLESGDILLALAGGSTDSIEAIRARLAEYSVGDEVELIWRRGDLVLSAIATLGERPPSTRSSSGRPGRAAHVIEVAEVRRGQTVAEVGFGSGWLCLALSEAVGPDGHVHALEIDQGDVEKLALRKRENMTVRRSSPDDTGLPASTFDTVVMHDVASHVAKKGRPRFYDSIAKALKPEGRVVIFGPHGKARAMLEELDSLGFALEDPSLLELSDDELDPRLNAGIRFYYRPN